MSRRPRVPGTEQPAVFRLAVATGGRPVDAFLQAVDSLPTDRGQVWTTAVHHDQGCPALDTGPIAICTCEIVEIAARRVA